MDDLRRSGGLIRDHEICLGAGQGLLAVCFPEHSRQGEGTAGRGHRLKYRDRSLLCGQHRSQRRQGVNGRPDRHIIIRENGGDGLCRVDGIVGIHRPNDRSVLPGIEDRIQEDAVLRHFLGRCIGGSGLRGGCRVILAVLIPQDLIGCVGAVPLGDRGVAVLLLRLGIGLCLPRKRHFRAASVQPPGRLRQCDPAGILGPVFRQGVIGGASAFFSIVQAANICAAALVDQALLLRKGRLDRGRDGCIFFGLRGVAGAAAVGAVQCAHAARAAHSQLCLGGGGAHGQGSSVAVIVPVAGAGGGGLDL